MSCSSDEQMDKELQCPLCMEPLELDDLDFYPCKCEYQICRFCWHRLRTDENGLCPACRQPYPEDPVNFKPISTADVQKHKDEKRLKKQAEKMRISESRQHLASYRVLQKNLVYVVGLSARVADQDILRKQEYFGRYGKIVKVVTGTSPSMHPNAQPSHSAYVTYSKVDEALRAIQGVNNSYLDGRLVKASLGTTKYCSSFLQSKKCFKVECMYLHEIAEAEISFTKDDMHMGKHSEYERKLLEAILSRNVSQGSGHERTRTNSSRQPLAMSKQEMSSAQWEAANDGGDELEANGDDDGVSRSASAVNIPKPGGNSNNNSSMYNDSSSNDGSSVEDPAPSNALKSHMNSSEAKAKRTKSSAKERDRHRDNALTAKSHSPPTDPEANENDTDNSLLRMTGMLHQLVADDDDDDDGLTAYGIPAPAKSVEAPAPLVQWNALLGMAPAQALNSHAINPASLFANLTGCLTSSSSSTAPPPQQSSSRLVTSSPPGLRRYGSDDDLGFDPFNESAKGLAMLLQEEEERIQQRKEQQAQQLHQHNQLSQLTSFLQQQQHQQQHQQAQHQMHLPSLNNLAQQQQQQQQQQQPVAQQTTPYGQPPSLRSLWSQPPQPPQQPTQQLGSLFQTPQQHQTHLQQIRQQMQQQHPNHAQQQQQQQFDPFAALGSSFFSQLQQQHHLHQPQQHHQQSQQQQPKSYQDLHAAAVAAAHLQHKQAMQQHHALAPPPGLSRSPQPPPQQHQHQHQHQQQQQSSSSSSSSSTANNMTLSDWQEGFKALLPNVNVRFMDNTNGSGGGGSSNSNNSGAVGMGAGMGMGGAIGDGRWSHESSLRSAIPPPPGFTSLVNR